jgi:hypothetical protein
MEPSQMRRKKISERMKLLQDLVPGCSKVTFFCGKNFSRTVLNSTPYHVASHR